MARKASGKTTLTLHCVAEQQKKGGVCAFVDAEHALDPQYARKLGVDLDELLISQPDTGEQALEITDTLVRSGAVSMVVVDSVAALTPKSELEGDMGDSNVGVQARLMSQAMRKLTGSISRIELHGDLHQPDPDENRRDVRQPETTTGGNALKFYSARFVWTFAASARSRTVTRWSATQTRVKVVKNKVAPAVQTGGIRHHVWRRHLEDGRAAGPWGQGRRGREIREAWFSYGDERIGQGRENAKTYPAGKRTYRAEIEDKIRAAHGLDFDMSEAGEDDSARSMTGRARRCDPSSRSQGPYGLHGILRNIWQPGPALFQFCNQKSAQFRPCGLGSKGAGTSTPAWG